MALNDHYAKADGKLITILVTGTPNFYCNIIKCSCIKGGEVVQRFVATKVDLCLKSLFLRKLFLASYVGILTSK